MTLKMEEELTEGALRIVKIAEVLFAEHGYSGTSLNAIAKQSGVSKANIFHHFENKEALYLTVLRQASKEMSGVLDEIRNPNSPTEDQIKQYSLQHLMNLFNNKNVTRLILREMQEDNGQQNVSMARDVLGEHFTRVVGLIETAQSENKIKNTIPAAVIAMTMVAGNVFYFQVHKFLDQFPELSGAEVPQNYSSAFSEILLNGILNNKD
ncbi:MAG: TetR/AcrR family transcriptional regulator [Pseudomonadales bacterium]|nr:TetR/AcrR family transcriptional regulator [Pseudomonadales bacterium]